jgi:hypothetical protein
LKQQEWPTLPNSKDKSFNELFTIGSESLIRVYLGICEHKKDTNELTKLFEEVRIKRNKIIHGIAKEILEPKYLLELQFRAANELFNNDFWTLIKNEEKRHPLYTELENEDLVSELYYKLNFVRKHIGKRKLKTFLRKNGREYLCPSCTNLAQDWEQGSVYLDPNKPNSTNAVCIICDQKYLVERVKCGVDNCQGNVIWNDDEEEIKRCLRCLSEIEIEN